jgi:UDP-GlcNAc:undecaprenyl-phosphate/decaprenyl-phosphate GlcNAc-1-phosphate transferase
MNQSGLRLAKNMSAMPILFSFAATLLLLALFLRNKALLQISDIPNERSLHAAPIPRFGGLAIMFGLLLSWVIAVVPLYWALVLAVLLLIAISLLDDARGMPIRWRFFAHFVAASLFTYFYIYPSVNAFFAVLLIIGIVWTMNLYNFMDGSDGLAGGMALFGFSVYGIAAFTANAVDFATMNFCIASAALGFLFYNFNPAKVFMGDSGSIPLGFLAAAMGLLGWVKGLWPFWFPMLVFSPFVVDATVTILKRLFRGKKIWQAHREHYYQRLVQMGWGHRKTALAEYALMFTVGAIALWNLQQNGQTQMMILCLVAIVYLILTTMISYQWRNHPARKTA